LIRGDGEGKWYFDRTAGLRVETPIVVEVEAYESQDSEVEEDLPSGNESTIAVECVAEVGCWVFLFGDG
jgi:hypothetical protein